MTAALAAAALLTLGQPAFAQTSTADAPGTVVRVGDDTLTCPQMADEAATISASMGEEGPGLLGRVTGVARAGASMLVPGAGLALAGADALTSSARDKKEAEAHAKRDRWNYLNGLYAGRGCGETGVETASAVQSVAPAAATATATPSAAPVAAAAGPSVTTPGATPTIATPVATPAITPTDFPH